MRVSSTPRPIGSIIDVTGILDRPHVCGLLPAIPHLPDRSPGPAWAETTAVIASVEKPGLAERVPRAIIPVAWGIVRRAADRTLNRTAVVGRLMIAGQEAMAIAVIDVSLLGGRAERDGWQQRQEDRDRYG